MSFKAKQQSAGDFKPVEVGVHRAVCSTLVDLGMQGGGQYAPAYKIALGFQLPDQLNDKGEPMTITQTFTASMHKKANLRKLIETWFGKAFPTEDVAKEFDLQALLGRVALINVVHVERQGKVYANISAVMGLTAGMEKPVLAGQPLFYSEDLPQADRSRAYAALPEWLRKKVDEQLRPGTPQGASTTDVADDDIPF